MQLRQLPVPDTDAPRGAFEVCRTFSTQALANHSLRAYFLAADYGLQHDIAFDVELLYVAAMVHDLGLSASFDNHRRPFESAGGDLAWAFAAGAGWPTARRDRVRAAVVDHMLEAVDVNRDPEGHLLMISTSFDISGRRRKAWTTELLDEVVKTYPRGSLTDEFVACFVHQAARKPDSTAAASVASGLAERMAAHPQEPGAGRDGVP